MLEYRIYSYRRFEFCIYLEFVYLSFGIYNNRVQFYSYIKRLPTPGDVVKLVDTHGSGPCGSNAVRVQISPSPQ
jgi:hypothetical protein